MPQLESIKVSELDSSNTLIVATFKQATDALRNIAATLTPENSSKKVRVVIRYTDTVTYTLKVALSMAEASIIDLTQIAKCHYYMTAKMVKMPIVTDTVWSSQIDNDLVKRLNKFHKDHPINDEGVCWDAEEHRLHPIPR